MAQLEEYEAGTGKTKGALDGPGSISPGYAQLAWRLALLATGIAGEVLTGPRRVVLAGSPDRTRRRK
jgi:hypothetical protein